MARLPIKGIMTMAKGAWRRVYTADWIFDSWLLWPPDKRPLKAGAKKEPYTLACIEIGGEALDNHRLTIPHLFRVVGLRIPTSVIGNLPFK